MSVSPLIRRGGRYAVEYLPAVALLAAAVVFWEWWVRTFDVRAYLLPAPTDIWQAFLDTADVLPGHTWTTLQEAVYGLAIGTVFGILIAIALVSVPLVRRSLYPIIVTSQTVPMIVLAPLLVIWFGYDMTPKIVVVALVAFFPVAVSTADGLAGADRDLVDLVRSMGARRIQVLRHVLIPGALPSVFAGLKIAASYAVVAAVIGEWVGGSSGLGLFITRSQSSFRTDQVFVAIAIIAICSIALFGAVQLAARLATPWAYATREKN